MRKAQKCLITGKVQGVFYRQSTLEQAKALGLTGWVRNLEKGEVECLICGELEALKVMGAWLQQGPARAEVKSVTIQEVPWEEHASFVILR